MPTLRAIYPKTLFKAPTVGGFVLDGCSSFVGMKFSISIRKDGVLFRLLEYL